MTADGIYVSRRSLDRQRALAQLASAFSALADESAGTDGVAAALLHVSHALLLITKIDPSGKAHALAKRALKQVQSKERDE